jgi:hypothetical protein
MKTKRIEKHVETQKASLSLSPGQLTNECAEESETAEEDRAPGDDVSSSIGGRQVGAHGDGQTDGKDRTV